MNSYVTVSNSVMQSLPTFSTPLVFYVYTYLKACSVNGLLCRTYKRMAEDLNISPASAQKAVRELCKRGLIYKKNRFGTRGYKANMYVFPEERNESYTKIPRSLFKENLKASEFMAIAYLAYRTGNKESAYPSYNQMAKDTGLSRRTLIAAVSVLKKKNILTVLNRFYVSCKDFRLTRARRSNLYKKFIKAVCATTEKLNTVKHNIEKAPATFKLRKEKKRSRLKVFEVGWCKIWQTVVRYTNYVFRKERKVINFT